MKVLVICIICLLWLRNSFAAPKWTAVTPIPHVNDSDFLQTDFDFSDLNSTALVDEFGCGDGPHQYRMSLDSGSGEGETHSLFWLGLPVLVGLYVLWLLTLLLYVDVVYLDEDTSDQAAEEDPVEGDAGVIVEDMDTKIVDQEVEALLDDLIQVVVDRKDTLGEDDSVSSEASDPATESSDWALVCLSVNQEPFPDVGDSKEPGTTDSKSSDSSSDSLLSTSQTEEDVTTYQAGRIFQTMGDDGQFLMSDDDSVDMDETTMEREVETVLEELLQDVVDIVETPEEEVGVSLEVLQLPDDQSIWSFLHLTVDRNPLPDVVCRREPAEQPTSPALDISLDIPPPVDPFGGHFEFRQIGAASDRIQFDQQTEEEDVPQEESPAVPSGEKRKKPNIFRRAFKALKKRKKGKSNPNGQLLISGDDSVEPSAPVGDSICNRVGSDQSKVTMNPVIEEEESLEWEMGLLSTSTRKRYRRPLLRRVLTMVRGVFRKKD